MPHVFEATAPERVARVPGGAIPVVMLHASLSSQSQWASLAERLSPRRDAIALDLVGYGGNLLPPPAPTFTVDDEVALVESRLLARVGTGPFHLVGHSYGGLVALRVAQRHAARVASLTLYEPVAFRLLGGDDPALAGVREIAERVQRHVGAGRNQDAAQAFVDYWNGSGYFAAIAPPTRHAIARRAAKVVLDFQAATRWPAHASELRLITAPTLVVVGTQSPAVTQRIAARIVAGIADCRLRACEAGHMGPITAPAIVNPCIESFIDECERRASRPLPAVATA